MSEQDLQDYTKWLMEVWNPTQLYIPFAVDAPKAYLRHRKEQLIEKWEKERVELSAEIKITRCIDKRMVLISRETTLSDCIKDFKNLNGKSWE